jgi:hypothetical protein
MWKQFISYAFNPTPLHLPILSHVNSQLAALVCTLDHVKHYAKTNKFTNHMTMSLSTLVLPLIPLTTASN